MSLYVKEIASGNLLYSRESSAGCSVMSWVGGMGEWESVPRGKEYMYTYR